jgi:hypothetical protein
VDIKQLKELRKLTGASLGECKRALESSASFDDAIVAAKAFVTAREAEEASGELERSERQQAAYAEQEAADAKAEYFKTMKMRFGLSQAEVETLLEEEGGDTERVLSRGAEILRESARQRQLASDAELDASGWCLETSFRSDKTLCGSSMVIIGFECVQDARMEFRIDLADGMMDRLRDWSEHLLMPGQDPSDPEPLGVWWIISADRRLIITMHGPGLEAVTVDDASVREADYPEVIALLDDLTNVAVRDLWIES